MKYRRLNQEELQYLEQEFVEFLVVNGIVASEWEVIKQQEPEKAESIIEQFSDVVFEGNLRKIKFIEHRSKHKILCFQCNENNITLFGLESDKDLSNSTINPQELLKGSKIYTQTKNYDTFREQELFKMLSEGCEISDGTFFKTLALVHAESKHQ